MYRLKFLGVCVSLLVCISLFGCVLPSALSTPWSENVALATYGTEGSHPALNDGKLETVAAIPAKNERIFMLKFPAVKPVRKIVIYNGNLYWFGVDYWDTNALEWKTFHSARQRRDIKNQNAQSEFVLDRLNFQTNMLRITVSRTVDDFVITKPVAERGDKILDRQLTIGGVYLPHYRILQPAWAQIREIEVYHLARK